MRLKEVKLAGFKSFVDPTTVLLPGNRCAVVGPNGCGKSNIIDAVRWVMGESSARQLRGESLTDVIFNGSSVRSPASLASIELIFDNRAGRVGGSLVEGKLANYAEIAIRREVARDSQSTYYLNGSRCRRRDIADVFLGTGFGPRSYSIIEQGMISELADAKPDELRGYLEEAAGVTKYKERRRETSNRIAHTVENLTRLHDVREELARQLAHLKRQARAAERYRELKAEERQRTAQLHAIRLTALQEALQAQAAAATKLEVEHAEAQSARQAIDTALERNRAAHARATDAVSDAQAQSYDRAAAVSKLEQAIDFDRKRKDELAREGRVLEGRQREIEAQLAGDTERVASLRGQLEAARPALGASQTRDAAAAQHLADLERQDRARQTEREAHSRRVNENDSEARVQSSRAEHGEQVLADLRSRLAKTAAEPVPEEDAELAELARAIGQTVRQLSTLAGAVQTNTEALEAAKQHRAEGEAALEHAREERLRREGRRAALAAAQEAALGRAATADCASEWLESAGLTDAPRLGENLAAQPGWERAVETVLRDDVQAVLVDEEEAFGKGIAALAGAANGAGRATLVLPRAGGDAGGGTPPAPSCPPLAGLVVGDAGSLLAGVYAADSLAAAMTARARLAPGESVITREGVWLGVDWIRVDEGLEEQGVLRRAGELEALVGKVAEAQADLNRKTALAEAARQAVLELEQQRETLRSRHGEAAAELARVKNAHDVRRVRQEEAQARQRRNAAERRDLEARIDAQAKAATAAGERLAELAAEAEQLAASGEAVRAVGEQHTEALEAARRAAREARDEYHRKNAQSQTLAASLAEVEAAHGRLLEQQRELGARMQEQRKAIAEIDTAAPARRAELQARLAERADVEKRLERLRERLEAINTEMAKALTARTESEREADAIRSRLEAARVEHGRLREKRDHLRTQLDETGIDLEEARAGYQAETVDGVAPDEAKWQEILLGLGARIARLGPINLAAIDEYETQSERKRYLDSQHEDLEQALATLRGAIGRIDRVTRARFKDTFNQVNRHLQALFPKFFGGGRASLQLTGEDWLDTGVTLMAQPPGKRNTSIHLLSGGEKAMTAVALIFSIFQMNPSPVCMLDEVDAPLDDTNVGRFADLIRELSADVQFVLITHNKQTMEMADHLLGVTMQEAGVSRLVSVDVEQAASMAAAG